MALDLALDLVALLSHLVQLTIQLVSCLQQPFNLDYFGTDVVSLLLKCLDLFIELFLFTFTVGLCVPAVARMIERGK